MPTPPRSQQDPSAPPDEAQLVQQAARPAEEAKQEDENQVEGAPKEKPAANVPAVSVLAELIKISNESPRPRDNEIIARLEAAYANNQTLGSTIYDKNGFNALLFAISIQCVPAIQWLCAENHDPEINYELTLKEGDQQKIGMHPKDDIECQPNHRNKLTALTFLLYQYRFRKIAWEDVSKILTLFKNKNAECGIDELRLAIYCSLEDNSQLVADIIQLFSLQNLLNLCGECKFNSFELARYYSSTQVAAYLNAQGAEGKEEEKEYKSSKFRDVVYYIQSDHIYYTSEEVHQRFNFISADTVDLNWQDQNGCTAYIYAAYYGNIDFARKLFEFAKRNNQLVRVGIKINNGYTAFLLSLDHEDEDRENPDTLLLRRREFITFALEKEGDLSEQSLKEAVCVASSNGNLFFLNRILPRLLPLDSKKLTELCEIGLVKAMSYGKFPVFNYWLKICEDNKLKLHPYLICKAFLNLNLDWAEKLCPHMSDWLDWEGEREVFFLQKSEFYFYPKPIKQIFLLYQNKQCDWNLAKVMLDFLHARGGVCGVNELCEAIKCSLDDHPQLVTYLVEKFNLKKIINTPNGKDLSPLNLAKKMVLTNIPNYFRQFVADEQKNEDAKPNEVLAVIESFASQHNFYNNEIISSRIIHAYRKQFQNPPSQEVLNALFACAVKYGNLYAAQALYECIGTYDKKLVLAVNHQALLEAIVQEDKNEVDNKDDTNLLVQKRRLAQFFLDNEDILGEVSSKLKAVVFTASKNNNLYFLKKNLAGSIGRLSNKKVEFAELAKLCEIGITQATAKNYKSVFEFWMGIRKQYNLTLHPSVFLWSLSRYREHKCFDYAEQLVACGIKTGWSGHLHENFELPEPVFYNSERPLLWCFSRYKKGVLQFEHIQKILLLLKQGKDSCGVEELCEAIEANVDDDPRLVAELIKVFAIKPELLTTENKNKITPVKLAENKALFNLVAFLKNKVSPEGKEEKEEKKSPRALVAVINDFCSNEKEYHKKATIAKRIRIAYDRDQDLSSQGAQDDKGDTPLIRAVRYRNLSAVEALFEFEEEINAGRLIDRQSLAIDHKNNNGHSALTVAVSYEDQENDDAEILQQRRKIITCLLKKKNYNLSVEELNIVVYQASTYKHLYFLQHILFGESEEQKKLISNKNNLEGLCAIGLRVAIRNDHSQIFDFWMDIKRKNNFPLPPHLLLEVAVCKRLEMAKKLIQYKADVNWQLFSFKVFEYLESSKSYGYKAYCYDKPLEFLLLQYAENKIDQETIIQWIELLKDTICSPQMLTNAVTGAKNDDPTVLKKLCELIPEKIDSMTLTTVIKFAVNKSLIRTVCALIKHGAPLTTGFMSVSCPPLVLAVSAGDLNFFDVVEKNDNAQREAATFLATNPTVLLAMKYPGMITKLFNLFKIELNSELVSNAISNKSCLEFLKAIEANGKLKAQAARLKLPNNLLLEALNVCGAQANNEGQEILNKLLSLFRFDLNPPVLSPLVHAAAQGLHHNALCLIQRGAQIDVKGASPALQAAKNQGQKNMVKLLVRSQASLAEAKYVLQQGQAEQKIDPVIENYLRAVQLIQQNKFEESEATETNETNDNGKEEKSKNLDQLIASLPGEDLINLYEHFQYRVQASKLRARINTPKAIINPSPHEFREPEMVCSPVFLLPGENSKNNPIIIAMSVYFNARNEQGLKLINDAISAAKLTNTSMDIPRCFMFAVRSGDTNLVAYLLKSCVEHNLKVKINLNAKAPFGDESVSYLETATKTNNLRMVTFLLQQPDVDINAVPALLTAASYGLIEVVKLLVLNGARVDEELLKSLNGFAGNDPKKLRVKNYLQAIIAIKQVDKSFVPQTLLSVHEADRESLYQLFHHSAYQVFLETAFQELAGKYRSQPLPNHAPNAPAAELVFAEQKEGEVVVVQGNQYEPPPAVATAAEIVASVSAEKSSPVGGPSLPPESHDGSAAMIPQQAAVAAPQGAASPDVQNNTTDQPAAVNLPVASSSSALIQQQLAPQQLIAPGGAQALQPQVNIGGAAAAPVPDQKRIYSSPVSSGSNSVTSDYFKNMEASLDYSENYLAAGDLTNAIKYARYAKRYLELCNKQEVRQYDFYFKCIDDLITEINSALQPVVEGQTPQPTLS